MILRLSKTNNIDSLLVFSVTTYSIISSPKKKKKKVWSQIWSRHFSQQRLFTKYVFPMLTKMVIDKKGDGQFYLEGMCS